MKPVITIIDTPEGAGRDISIERAVLPAAAVIRQFTYRGDREALVEACREASVLLCDYATIDADLMDRLPALRLVSLASTGFDSVDVEAAKARGISVCCVHEYCTDEVADHALALLLALNRRLFDYARQVQHDRSWAWDRVTGLRRLSGQVLGIVGLGRIGRAVATRARGFGMKIIAHDPWLRGADVPRDVPLLSLADLLQRADILSLHCNAAADAAPLLGAAEFALMRRRPLLINVARGRLIDERALVAALDEGRLAGAALDVLREEPPDLDGHPLRGRDDVILTPHVAFNSDQSLKDVRRISAQNILHFLDGRFEAVSGFVHLARSR